MSEDSSNNVGNFLHRRRGPKRELLRLARDFDYAASEYLACQKPRGVLVGLELLRTRRQANQAPLAAECFDEISDLGAAMRRMAIYISVEGLRGAVSESPEKLDKNIGGETLGRGHESELVSGAEDQNELDVGIGRLNQGRQADRCPGCFRLLVLAHRRFVAIKDLGRPGPGFGAHVWRFVLDRAADQRRIVPVGAHQCAQRRQAGLAALLSDALPGSLVFELLSDHRLSCRVRSQHELELEVRRVRERDQPVQPITRFTVDFGLCARNRSGTQCLKAAFSVPRQSSPTSQQRKTRCVRHDFGRFTRSNMLECTDPKLLECEFR